MSGWPACGPQLYDLYGVLVHHGHRWAGRICKHEPHVLAALDALALRGSIWLTSAVAIVSVADVILLAADIIRHMLSLQTRLRPLLVWPLWPLRCGFPQFALWPLRVLREGRQRHLAPL
jgi:hypothetical protein